jgi:Obg family GTPase CgtA-like protein
VPVILTSSVTRLGLDTLSRELMRRIPVDQPGAAGEGGAGTAAGPNAGTAAGPNAGTAAGPNAGTAAGGGAGVTEPGERETAIGDLAEHRIFRPSAPRTFTVQRVGDGSFRVSGEGIERLVARYDLDNEDALAHLERRLKGIGVIRALEAKGFEAGDEVEIAGVAFDLDPEV